MDNPEPPFVERATSTALTLFLFIAIQGVSGIIYYLMNFCLSSFKSRKYPIKIFLAIIFLFPLLCSCSSSRTITFSCQERNIEIYVDDEYLGRDLVRYTVPKDRKYIEVSCRDNGVEVYHRRISVDSRKGTLVELQIPKHYRYSSKPF